MRTKRKFHAHKKKSYAHKKNFHAHKNYDWCGQLCNTWCKTFMTGQIGDQMYKLNLAMGSSSKAIEIPHPKTIVSTDSIHYPQGVWENKPYIHCFLVMVI